MQETFRSCNTERRATERAMVGFPNFNVPGDEAGR